MRTILAGILGLGVLPVLAEKQGYDPMALPTGAEVLTKDLTITDEERSRVIPLRVYYSKTANKAPVVLFSHGLGGSRENNKYLGEHWAARGYVLVVMQHAGSDVDVWKSVPADQRRSALTRAASGKSSLDRNADVGATLDQLEKWNAEKGHLFFGKMDLGRVGMSGHSFGAVTTQAVSGQSYGPAGKRFTDKRIDAAIAFSPSPPNLGDPAKAFGQVEVPWLLMTGTNDKSAIGRTTPEKRQEVYPHLPEGGKYELVLHEAEHMAFSDRTLRGREHRNPNHHKAILALSTAFWDSYLGGNAAAKLWLDGSGARAVLEPKDRWQRK